MTFAAKMHFSLRDCMCAATDTTSAERPTEKNGEAARTRKLIRPGSAPPPSARCRR